MTEIKIGKYIVLGELGRGAMGIVYKAEDPYIGRTVAVKTIRFDAGEPGAHREEAQRRFLREARSAGSLSHPNIVTVYDVGEDRGMTYIAMAYIDGSSMEDLLESGVKFTVEDAVALIIPIADALETAHRKGIVHRDIKPGNILIDQEGRPYLADFGIARVSSSTMTQTSMIMGTPFYMSPEQVAGRKVDNRSDIFALGAVLYEMLTLQKPFSGESLATVIYKIMNENPPPVRSIQKNVPAGIDDIIEKALSKDPEARYRNCREFINDLKNHSKLAAWPLLVEEPPVERPPEVREAPPPPLDFRPERNRKPLLIILASMMALVATVVAAVLFLGRTPNQVPTSSGGGLIPGSVHSLSVRDSLASAVDLWKNSNFTEAIKTYKAILAVDPDHFEARMGLAGVLEDLGRWEEAAVEYEKAGALDGSDSRPFRRLGVIFEQRGDRDKALAYYRRALSVMSDGAEANLVSRLIADLEARPTPAEPDPPPDIEPRKPDPQVVETLPDKPEAKIQDKPETKISDKPETQVMDKPEAKERDKAEVKVREEPEAKDPAKPETKDQQVKADEPPVKAKDINPYVERGVEAFHAGDFEKAAQLLEFVLKNDPQNIYAKEYLSLASKKLDDQERERRMRFDMENATEAMRKGAFKSAIEDLNKILAADSRNETAGKMLIEALVKIAPGEIISLVNQYVEAVEKQQLTGFYRKHCSPDLLNRISRDTDMIVGMYTQLTAIATNVRVAFQNTRHDSFQVEARFAHIMTGVSRESGRRESLFDGVYRWNLQRRNDVWRITDIRFETAKKYP